MRTPETVVFANMCMICDDNQNVLVQDRIDPNWSGLTFPGGHVKGGEAFADAVIREVWEETGLTIRQPRLCGMKDWIEENGTRYVVHLYKAVQFEGDLKSSDEGKVFWLPLAELSKQKLANGMDLMLRVFCESAFSEMYFCKKENGWKPILK